MNFTPLGERVLVKRLEEESKTSSGIIIPDAAKEKPLVGTIEAISQSACKDALGPLKQGDKVIFSKYKGDEIKLDGTHYIVLNIEDVLGILG